MRLRAGLTNDPLDYSYKPEDYAAAMCVKNYHLFVDCFLSNYSLSYYH